MGFALVYGGSHIMATQPPQPRACVILQSKQIIQQTPNGPVYVGIGVYCSSSSSNAPRFDPGAFDQSGNSQPLWPLAEAIAQCLEAGFHIESTDPLILVK